MNYIVCVFVFVFFCFACECCLHFSLSLALTVVIPRLGACVNSCHYFKDGVRCGHGSVPHAMYGLTSRVILCP